MSAGCYSWCCLFTPRGVKKRISETKSDEYTAVENQATGEKSVARSSEIAQAVVPTTTQYITASGKEILTLLQSAAGVIPVPLLKDAIEVALKIIEVCEEASAVEQKVKELQDRVGHLMVVIVDHVTSKNEEGSKEVVVTAAKGIEEDIKGLLSTLRTINGDLTRITAQNGWVIAIYRELNMTTLEDCMNRLSAAMEKFKLANDLRDSDLLQELHTRLGKIDNKVDDISRDIKHMDTKVDNIADKIEGIDEVVKRLATLLPSDTVARQRIPLKPEIFHGRDDLVEEIAQLFMKEKTSHVCILGPGGMGKTSVTLAVVESSLVQERFPRGNHIWVPCNGATSAALFLEILYVQLQVPGDKQVTLEKIISALGSSNDPRLIILDNFETPFNAPGGTQKEVEDILRQLAQLNHVAILVTMRGKYPPCPNAIKWQSKNIQPTDEEACFRIFHEIYPSSKDDPGIGRLLSVLGYMPFAVTLMANLAKDGQSTANELLDAWSESGPDILSDNPEQGMNRSISLSVDSDLVKRNTNAVLLLAILSLLPAGTTKENLRWWAPALKTSMIPSAIATLSKAALLVENKREDSDSPVLFVVPVVQSFMRHNRIEHELQKQIHLSSCQYVLDHACRFDDPAFPVKSKALAAEDTNIQSLLLGSPTMQHIVSPDITTEALIAFCWHRCDTKPNPEIADYAVTVAEASGIEKDIASATWCLGRTYYALANYELSYDHLQKAYQLFNSLSPGDLELQRLACQCGIDLVDTATCSTLKDKNEAVLLAMEVETRCAALSDDLLHGRSLVFVGQALLWTRQWQDALSYLKRAKTMLEAVGNTSNLAEACQVTATAYYFARRLPEALDAITEAWKQAEMSGSLLIQASNSRDFAKILFSANRDAEAWKYIEIALMKASHLGNQLDVAISLEYMGYGYLRREDYQNAFGAYEAAAEKYFGTTYDSDQEVCKDNMARITQKQTNPDAVVGFNRPLYDVDSESLFYPSVQVTANAPISSS